MNVRELLTLLECPKCYDLDRVILHPKVIQEMIFQECAEILNCNLIGQNPWDDFSTRIHELLQKSYRDDWYEIEWQKRKAVSDEMFRLKRMYHWMRTNLKGKISSNIMFEMDYNDTVHEHFVSKLKITADLMVEISEKNILAILIRQQMESSSRHRKKIGKELLISDLELLVLMMCLRESYPEHNIKVVRLCSKSIKDSKSTFAVFEETYGDNLLQLSLEDYLSYTGNDELAFLKSAVKVRKLRGCRQCRFEQVCLPATNLVLSSDSDTCEKQRTLEYTEQQQNCIMHKDGPLRVSAGPGAGKTATLVARIEKLMKDGVEPDRILALTFTRKAAKEILSRLCFEEKPQVQTIHALGFSIIRRYESLIGKKKLINKVDCMQLLKKILLQMPIIFGVSDMELTGKNGLLESLFSDFSFIERYGTAKFHKDFPEKDCEAIIKIKEIYDLHFNSAGYITYDDQIYLAEKLLKKNPGVRMQIQNMFDYILVDEAQDMDEMQISFIQQIVKSPQNNLAVYGDADQSIYGFRGSSNRFMLEFDQLYPGTTDVRLDTNFRSAKEISLTTNRLIGHNSDRISFESHAIWESQEKPMLLQNFSMSRIGHFVNDVIKEGYSLGDIAIIARTNKELEKICLLLEKYNEEHPDMPILRYEKPKYYLYQDFVFQTLLDLLEIYHGNYEDDMVWYRLLQTQDILPEKERKNRSIYRDYLARGMIYPFDTEEATCYLAMNPNQTKLLQAFSKIYRAIHYFQLSTLAALQKVIEAYIDPRIESKTALEMLREQISERRIGNATELWNYMKALQKYEDPTRIIYEDVCKQKVHLLTAHDSKGKEFSVVLVCNVDDFESNNMQEDRRLLYVAMTRAKERLFLTERCKGKSTMIRELDDSICLMEGENNV